MLIDHPVSAGLLDLPCVFGNRRPVEIEVGTGKGTFLLARAAARPELNFLGIECAASYCRYAADRLRRADLPNVRMVQVDAAAFFPRCLADQAAWRVHVYFPDPWPKRRHHRRRLIQAAWIEQVRRVLRLGGQFLIVTDHLEYFAHIHHVLSTVTGLACVSFPSMADKQDELVGTNFERKYIACGRAFYHVARMRIG